MTSASRTMFTVFGALAFAIATHVSAQAADGAKPVEKEPPPLSSSELKVSPVAENLLVRRYAVTTELQRTARGTVDAILQEWLTASATKTFDEAAAGKARNAEACLTARAHRLGVAASSSDIDELKSALSADRRLSWAKAKAERQAENHSPNVSSDESACRAAGL